MREDENDRDDDRPRRRSSSGGGIGTMGILLIVAAVGCVVALPVIAILIGLLLPAVQNYSACRAGENVERSEADWRGTVQPSQRPRQFAAALFEDQNTAGRA